MSAALFSKFTCCVIVYLNILLHWRIRLYMNPAWLFSRCILSFHARCPAKCNYLQIHNNSVIAALCMTRVVRNRIPYVVLAYATRYILLYKDIYSALYKKYQFWNAVLCLKILVHPVLCLIRCVMRSIDWCCVICMYYTFLIHM